MAEFSKLQNINSAQKIMSKNLRNYFNKMPLTVKKRILGMHVIKKVQDLLIGTFLVKLC